jgi:phosphate transport system permease protein
MKIFFKKLSVKLIEGALMISGAVTSITVLLIVVFLFKEGLGVFGQSPIAKNYVIAANGNNPVKKVSPSQIKDIFNKEIINWKQLGGKDEPIVTFTLNDISNYYSDEELGDLSDTILTRKINALVAKTPGIIAYFSKKYVGKGFSGHKFDVANINLSSFITGKQWYPTSEPAAQFGVLPLIMGTLWVSLAAILIALPLGLATAIYMAEIADERLRNILKPIIELLAGIPSVVYGFFGLVVIVPLIQKTFGLDVGETGLAGSIILAIMALPTIITVSEDAIRTTPRAMKEASLALGATKWQTIVRVIIPYSSSGISAGAILGIGRAIGETMAVLMVTGNASVMPHSLLQPVRTIPATIAAELGETQFGGIHFKALFALGCILFLITFLINLTVEFISSKRKYSK